MEVRPMRVQTKGRGRKVVFYELNEVPSKVLDFFVQKKPTSSLAHLLPVSRRVTTYTEDEGHLSPWVTWPTLHRGVTNRDHGIFDFGQNLSHVNKNFPSIWEILAAAKVRTGVFGSLHSYPLPQDLTCYAFYVPDTFAAGPETHPRALEAFQSFNLKMVDRSGRNVSTGVDLNSAFKMAVTSLSLGLTARTGLRVCMQLLAERANATRKVRRRTFQAILGFDFFLNQLKVTQPESAFFFTNHVASAMHRYWPATFPEDYPEDLWGRDWRAAYEGEIYFAMEHADEQIGALARFAKRHDYVLAICSSMGQGPVSSARVLKSQLNMYDACRFLEFLGLERHEFELRRNMAPRYSFAVSDARAEFLSGQLQKVRVQGCPLDFVRYKSGVFRVELGQANLRDEDLEIVFDGERVQVADIGFVNLKVQDEASSNAYHIPEGILVIFDPRGSSEKVFHGDSRVSTLDIAPAILKNFGIPPRAYMRSPNWEL
jgi:hypothetical protein